MFNEKANDLLKNKSIDYVENLICDQILKFKEEYNLEMERSRIYDVKLKSIEEKYFNQDKVNNKLLNEVKLNQKTMNELYEKINILENKIKNNEIANIDNINHINIQNEHITMYKKATSVLRGNAINQVTNILDEKRKLIDNLNQTVPEKNKINDNKITRHYTDQFLNPKKHYTPIKSNKSSDLNQINANDLIIKHQSKDNNKTEEKLNDLSLEKSDNEFFKSNDVDTNSAIINKRGTINQNTYKTIDRDNFDKIHSSNIKKT